jgi:hypothetical protein
LRLLARRLPDVIRGFDTLIWALLFVGAVGLGPFAGIPPLQVSDTPALGSLFSEAIEAIRARERETVNRQAATIDLTTMLVAGERACHRGPKFRHACKINLKTPARTLRPHITNQ